ncbi:MAG: hypothetical protein KGZ43_00110 [Sulfuritalea sp.]|nr:hypothetical protein [Sulfuritalea sp.]
MMLRAALGRVLLIVVVLEVSLGGGGRLFDTGSGSPRMVLFGLGLAYVAAALLYREKIPREFVFLSVLFVVLSGVSTLIPVLQGQSVVAALGDFKPLAYFLMLPFFALTIRNMDDVVLVGRLLKSSALILALLYLGVMAFWKAGGMTVMQMYEWLNPAHSAEAEFLFRGDDTFFFKALLYVGVGVFFLVAEKNRYWLGMASMLLLAIALTMTRGMWLAVFMVLAAWAFFYAADRLKGAALAGGLLFVGVIGVAIINETLPSVTQSNAIRWNDAKKLAEALPSAEALPLFFGGGFGTEVLGREAIEITYVNVFFKQGLVGLLFWFLPAVYLAWQLRLVRDAALRPLAMPYVMAVAFVYAVSLTNPFLTNPIGMAVVLIAMAAVRVVRLSERLLP